MKKFSQALVWLTLSEVIYNIGGYIIQSSLGRILGPEEYGRYGLVVTLTTMIIILIGNGIPTAMSKYLSEIFESAPGKILGIKYQALRLQAILMLSVTAVFFFASPLIAWVLRDPSLTPLFQLSSLIIPAFASASFYFYYFTGLHFFRIQAALKTLRAISRVVFIVLLASFFGVEGAIAGYIIAPLFVFGLAILFDLLVTHRYFPTLRDTRRKEVALFSGKTILAYAGPLTAFLLFYELILTLDLYFVKSMLGSDYLTGIYNAAITVGRIPYFLFYALTIILLPAISKTTAEADTAGTESLVNRSLRLMTFLLFPMVTLLISFGSQVLHFFYGARYAEALAPMSVFAVGVGFLTVFYVLSFALNGAGLVKIPMYLACGGFLLMIIFNVLLIPVFGLVGAALSTTITSFFLMVAILVVTARHFRVKLSVRTILLSLLGTLMIALVAPYLPHGPISFFLSGGFLFVLYFIYLRLVKELSDTDIAPLQKLFRPLTKN